MITTQPKIGDIGLTQIEGFTGWCIKVAQRLNGSKKKDARFQHAFIMVGSDYVVEAEPGGALLTKFSERYDYRDVVWLDMTEAVHLKAESLGETDEKIRIELCNEATKLIGTPYSFLDYVALLLHRFRIPLPGVKKRVASSKHLICSQLVVEVYRREGIDLFPGRWTGYVTPADLCQAFGDH